MPELKEILGALIFGAERPISLNEMRRCLRSVAEAEGGETAPFAGVRKRDIATALEELQETLRATKCGFHLSEVAGGYRLQSNTSCAKWLKDLLNLGRPQRLSRPALETLAIIAYRQPVTKAQIEGVRGVAVDHLIKSLMELQLVKITGRSELPGRPFLYGTTHVFLEHFGLSGLHELSDIEPMLMLKAEQRDATDGESAVEPAAEAEATDASPEKTAVTEEVAEPSGEVDPSAESEKEPSP
jgi:segregation and condensation protein B